ncbi:uncharacterized protein FIBRA_03476 [Fibroporia radiculosa]|uniref:SH3 domain-containing protein n=1 Tax=Fibroporia radiculosa TaxID=599839 RepID=J4GNI0_9APHY|nr:uncharacterized protein FIBRA_03476 [Fibroporia radiculosa]CCM01425.1 predicted protein [Fibroporia radiculosa]
MSKKSSDPEFDDYARRFAAIETATEKLLKDTKVYNESVSNLFTYGAGFAQHFTTIFHPVVGEYDIVGKHPESEHTVRNIDSYESALQELKAAIVPELELIESRIVGPVKELQSIMKVVMSACGTSSARAIAFWMLLDDLRIGLVDYDRYNNSLTKLRDKKEKSLNDERNLFKLEQDFEVASNEYDYINSTLKTELPRFLMQATQFIDPLFHSFFYMQLNVFYLMLEKLNGFAEGRYDVSISGAEIASEYETKRTDAWENIEALHICQRFVSTSKLVQAHRAAGGPGSAPSLGRTPTSTTTSSIGSSYAKKAPPPPPSAGLSAPPPPYSPSASPAMGSAPIKKAPPPPPPVKPKPKPAASYVVALYDFSPQAEGDLEFKAGDRIEVVERTDSAEDWWTGRVGNRQGTFPGNYVQES